MSSTINDVIRDAMVEFGYDREKVIAALGRRKNNPELNEAFRLRGISNSVASFQSALRHDIGDHRAQKKPDLRPNLSPAVKANIARNAKLEAVREPARRLVATARLFWDNYTLDGGAVTLANATRPELLRSADAHATRENGFRERRLFETAVAAKMAKGSVTQKVSDVWSIDNIMETAREYGRLPAVDAA